MSTRTRRTADRQILRSADHSKLRRADWVGTGMDDLPSDHASKVLPAGRPGARRRVARVARSRPATSAARSTRSTSAGSQRCALAVAITSGAAARR